MLTSLIPWKTPLPIKRMDGYRCFGCRFCISRLGLKAQEMETVPYTFKSEEDCAAHIALCHPSL